MIDKVPSMKGGGSLWFTDLTTPDPLYILPVLTALIFLVTVEVYTLSGAFVVFVIVEVTWCTAAC
jgi:YidC/Oxa1 family membrane protein insertase